MKHLTFTFMTITALATLGGCKPDSGGNAGNGGDGGQNGGDNNPPATVCPSDDEVRYVSDDPEVCKQVRFACNPGETMYSDPECGCGCELPECAPASADLTYVATDPDQCAAIRFMCPVGFTAWSSDCGCGCERAEPEGQSCGGIMGKTCADGFYCDFPAATNCGSGDQMGTCAERPDVCYMLYKPVCGCDGNTYSNDCTAASAGVSVAYDGACTTTPIGE